MASINGILRINDNGNGVIESFTSNVSSNNLSQLPHSTNVLSFLNSLTRDNELYTGAIGTPIGKTTIGNLRFGVANSNNVRSESYKGMDFGFTNENGVLNLTLTIVGTDVISFMLRFDSLRNQYPTDYTWYDIDNEAHIITGNTSNELVFQQRTGYGTTTIVFSQWNLPNTSVGLTFIESVELDLYLNKLQIVNFESQAQIKSDVRQIDYGLLANTGKIELKDVDNKILENAKMGYLDTYLFTLDLYLNNKLFQKHITNQTPYYDENKTIQLQLTNELEKWNQVQIGDISFANTTLFNVFSRVLFEFDRELAPSRIIGAKKIVVSTYTNGVQQDRNVNLATYLNDIKIQPFTLKKDSLANQIKKICTVAQLCLYIDDNGEIKLTSARPKLLSYQYDTMEAIGIGYSEETSSLDYDILVSNRYDDVEFS